MEIRNDIVDGGRYGKSPWTRHDRYRLNQHDRDAADPADGS
jgi:hypothetical protein